MRDHQKRNCKNWDEVLRAQQSRRGRKRNTATLVKRIQQISGPEYVEDPNQRYAHFRPKSRQRDKSQGRRCKITVGEIASEYSGGQLRCNHSRDQGCEPDIPEPMQHKNRSERSCAFSFANRRPNVLRGENTPSKKAESRTCAPDQRNRHDAFLSSSASESLYSSQETNHAHVMIQTSCATRGKIADHKI
jgi:hypothetical protein